MNQSVKDLGIANNFVGSKGVIAIAQALKVNQSLKMLCIGHNSIGLKGAKALSEALKVNNNITLLSLWGSFIDTEGQRALLESFQVNSSLTKFYVYNDDVFHWEMDACFEYNINMHNRARESVVHLLALRSARRLLWIPKEIMVLLGHMLWKTKCDSDAWNNKQRKRNKK